MVKLTEDQIKFYKDNGYIILRNIFTKEEIDEFVAEYDRIFYEKNNPGMETAWEATHISAMANHESYSTLAVHNLQYHSDVFSRMLLNVNLLDAFEGVMGTKNILLHHNKAHLKPPGKGAPYPMHQDYHYFPYKNDSMTAAFIHIHKTDPENGGLCIYPGSHKNGPLEDVGVHEQVDVSGNHIHYMDPAKYPIEKAIPVIAEPGDVVIFTYLTLHGSYRNLSTRPRGMLLIQVRAADDEPLLDTHKSEGQDFVMRGKNDKKPAGMFSRFQH